VKQEKEETFVQIALTQYISRNSKIEKPMMTSQKEIDNQMKSSKPGFSQSSSQHIMKSLDSIDQDLDIEDLLNTSSYIFTSRHKSIDSYEIIKPKTA
jgi:response regulator of citrate/malate metabolism